MKYVILLLSEASKIDFGGSDKLAKNDHIVLVHVKGKKTIPASLEDVFENIKATVDYFEIAQTSDAWLSVAYLMGYHIASKHDVYVVTKDKTKIPNKLVGDAHIYASFKSIAGASTTTTKKTTSKSTAKKSTTAKKTTTKKSTTSAKSTKTTTKKTTAKQEEPTVLDVIGSLIGGDTKSNKSSKSQGGLIDLAGQLLGGK